MQFKSDVAFCAYYFQNTAFRIKVGTGVGIATCQRKEHTQHSEQLRHASIFGPINSTH